MVIREVQDRDFVQLAEMRWTHAVEDDETYGEHNTDGVTKSVFIEEFVAFLYTNKGYKIFVAEDENAKILSAMFVYLIPKIPTPNVKREFIAYLTKLFTLEEYRGQGHRHSTARLCKELPFVNQLRTCLCMAKQKFVRMV